VVEVDTVGFAQYAEAKERQKMRALEVLRKLKRTTNSEVYLVGGFVRDYLRRKKNYDLDVVVRGLTKKQIISYIRKYGKIKVITMPRLDGKEGEKDVILFYPFSNGYDVQITTIDTRSSSLKKDALGRDFTVNALYLPIDFKSRKDVIDKVGGKKDIVHRRIRTVTQPGNIANTFEASPIRILRAMSLSARTGYKIDADVLHAIAHLVSNDTKSFKDVPPEAIRAEIEEILLSKKPSTYFRLMRRIGILEYVLPELNNCFGVKQQEEYHKYDVFEHSLRACDATAPDLMLRWGALLHDIGKPDTKQKRDGRATFHKHEMVGVKLARELLDRLKYDSKTRKSIIHLVRLHMYHYTRDFTDTAVRKFMRKAGINGSNVDDLDNFPLFQIRAAERLGNGLKTVAVTERQKDFQARIKRIYVESQVLDLHDLNINGFKIMEVFDLKSSDKIGHILKYLLEKILEHPELNKEDELLEITANYLAEEIYDKLKTQ
jgi:tRNA nucleotidyltransferase (CCA-adding enzyme)